MDVVILPELQQCFRGVFLHYSDSLGKGPPQDLKISCNSLIHWLDQKGGVLRDKYHFDFGMKINNKQNLERYAVL